MESGETGNSSFEETDLSPTERSGFGIKSDSFRRVQIRWAKAHILDTSSTWKKKSFRVNVHYKIIKRPRRVLRAHISTILALHNIFPCCVLLSERKPVKRLDVLVHGYTYFALDSFIPHCATISSLGGFGLGCIWHQSWGSHTLNNSHILNTPSSIKIVVSCASSFRDRIHFPLSGVENSHYNTRLARRAILQSGCFLPRWSKRFWRVSSSWYTHLVSTHFFCETLDFPRMVGHLTWNRILTLLAGHLNNPPVPNLAYWKRGQ